MSTVYVFADETGNFDFSRHKSATKYFGVGTIVLRDHEPDALSADMAQLRRELAWKDQGLDSCFHATEDKQPVRDEVFGLISRHAFRFDVTLLEKSKSQPQLRTSDHTFYKYAWFYHLRALARSEFRQGDSVFLVTSAIGTKKGRALFRAAVDDVMRQNLSYRVPRVLAFWPNSSDACLQVADYCLWAVSRKYERNDTRSYDLIKAKIRREYDLFAAGTVHYY
ncbi:DUF3800 domain-containing protein [Amycolatopsis sp. NPDC051045]|uniref:DUF3800 domain-containing protein n=1 Tax=Amycolatopsis sp. NPDC051045 TaxID=3156922 RepID=UPI003445F9B1